jgi:hypothetical protein
LSPARRFVKEGELTEINPATGEKRHIYLYCFNDLLIWVRPKKKSFEKLCYLVDIEARPGVSDGNMVILLVALQTKESLMIYDKTEDATEGWFSAVLDCRAETLEKEHFAQGKLIFWFYFSSCKEKNICS